MKRILCLVLLLSVLAGCRGRDGNTDSAAEADAALRAYAAVLENTATVCVASSGDTVYIRDCLPSEMSVYQYAVVDLDSDSVPEAVLRLKYYENDTAGFAVLHSSDGTVYWFDFPYRGFNRLKADGTFSWANSAFNGGIAQITFDGGAYTKTDLACRDSAPDGNAMNCRIGDESVSYEEYCTFIEAHDQKANPEWKEYSIEAFRESVALLSAGTGE